MAGFGDALAGFGPAELAVAALALFLGGFAKGALGVGLPTIAISGIAVVAAPDLAVAILVAPILATNVWQAFRQGVGAAWETTREMRRSLIALCLAMPLAAQVAARAPEALLLALLGATVALFSVAQLAGWRPTPPARRAGAAEAAMGAAAGALGGLTGVWGPPFTLWLMAKNTEKRAQIRALGVAFMLGGVVFALSHAASGLLNGVTARLSLIAMAPALCGMALGMVAQDRLDQATFRRATLIALTLAGLNLLRRALV